MINKITRCPFCGNDNFVCIAIVAGWYFICPKCNARGPKAGSSIGTITSWNKRIKIEEDNEPKYQCDSCQYEKECGVNKYKLYQDYYIPCITGG